MAKYLQGIMGAFSGAIGPVVGSSRNGVPYIKGKGKPRSGPIGETEAGNMKKFANGHAWLKPLLPLLRVGFNGYSQTTYGYNAAKSYNFRYAMENGQMIPSRVKVSSGDLPLSANISVVLETSENPNWNESSHPGQAINQTIHFSWSPAYIDGANNKDQIMVLAYHPESGTALQEIHGAFRESGEQRLKITSDLAGKTVCVYAAFVAADRSRQSDSVFLGEYLP